MQYIHVKNIDKYHPGYKDGRVIIWMKLSFKTLNGDAEFEMLHEIDQMRYLKLCMLELQNKKPLPLDVKYLSKRMDFKARPFKKTIKALANFVEITEVAETTNVTEEDNSCNKMLQETNEDFERVWQLYPSRIGKKAALKHWGASVKTAEDVQRVIQAIDNYKQSKQFKDGYVKNGSTFFNEWQDWADHKAVDNDGVPEEWKTKSSQKK